MKIKIMAILSILAASFFASWNWDFLFGLIVGCCGIYLFTATVGKMIFDRHVARLDKIERDYLEAIREGINH